MLRFLILYVFLTIGALFPSIWAQNADSSDWQSPLLDLIDVDEFSEAQYVRLLEVIEEQQREQDTLLRQRQTLLLRADRCLNQREGYRHVTRSRQQANKAYLGDPVHESVRYDLQMSRGDARWRTGFVLDKDAGERWRWNPPFADSFSLYASYQRKSGILRQAIVGHYRLQLGCGLLVNQQYTLGKNLQSLAFFQAGEELHVHSSASEEGYMQGLAAKLRIARRWELIPFVSARQIDGSLDSNRLISWAKDGYHRTQGEADKRHAAWLSNSGLRLQYRGGEWLELGTNILYSHFSHAYELPVRTYNERWFRGRDLWQASVDYRAQWWGFDLRGELAVDDRGGWATTDGIHHPLGSDWNATLLFRNYNRHYRQLLASSISESSAMQGETGLTLQAEGPLSRHWRLETYADWFHFSQPQYNIYQPSEGYEISAKAIWKRNIRRRNHTILPMEASLRYRIKAKYKNNTLTEAPADLTPYYRHTLDGVFAFDPTANLRLKTQIRSRFYSAQNIGGVSSGLAVSQALIWNPRQLPIQGEIQAAWFDADDYDCRLYLSERNILYGFALPMLYGQGERLSLTGTYRITSHLQSEVKLALTHYEKTSTIGSGLQKINGSLRCDLWLQLRATLPL